MLMLRIPWKFRTLWLYQTNLYLGRFSMTRGPALGPDRVRALFVPSALPISLFFFRFPSVACMRLYSHYVGLSVGRSVGRSVITLFCIAFFYVFELFWCIEVHFWDFSTFLRLPYISEFFLYFIKYCSESKRLMAVGLVFYMGNINEIMVM